MKLPRSKAEGLPAKMERYREAYEVAKAWVNKFGRNPDGNVARLLIEMLRMVAFRQLADMSIANGRRPTRPAELAVLAKAIKEMEGASKTIAESETRLREKLRADVDRKVDEMKHGGAGAPGDVAALDKAKELVRGLL